jgi:hypothetical protein
MDAIAGDLIDAVIPFLRVSMLGLPRYVYAERVEIDSPEELPTGVVRVEQHGVVTVDVVEGTLEPLLGSLGQCRASSQQQRNEHA